MKTGVMACPACGASAIIEPDEGRFLCGSWLNAVGRLHRSPACIEATENPSGDALAEKGD